MFVSLMWKNKLFQRRRKYGMSIFKQSIQFCLFIGKITNSSSLPLSCALWIQQNEPYVDFMTIWLVVIEKMNEMSMVYQGKEKGSNVILQDCTHIMLNSRGRKGLKER